MDGQSVLRIQDHLALQESCLKESTGRRGNFIRQETIKLGPFHSVVEEGEIAATRTNQQHNAQPCPPESYCHVMKYRDYNW